MGGISIHIGRVMTGLAFVASLVDAAGGPSAAFTWSGLQQLGTNITTNAAVQRNLALSGGAYVAMRAIGPSVEKKPLAQLGKLRIYAM